MPDPGLIDPALVREQLGGLPDAMAGRIVAAFEADLAALRERLLDPAQAAAARHELRGLAGNFGAARLIAAGCAWAPDAAVLDRVIAETVAALRAVI